MRLAAEPNIPVARLAREVGVRRASLYESPEFKPVQDQIERMLASGARGETPGVPDLPRGFRLDNGSTEAVA